VGGPFVVAPANLAGIELPGKTFCETPNGIVSTYWDLPVVMYAIRISFDVKLYLF